MKPFVVYRHGRLTFPATVLGELERPVPLVCAEKFSDKIGAVRTTTTSRSTAPRSARRCTATRDEVRVAFGE